MGGIGPSDAADPSQLFALRWTDFHQCILTTFRVLRDEEDFVDVTVSCENVQYGAHKVLLSACSPFFRSLLKANPCPHPIIILNNVRRIDFEALLKFMYNGEVHISQEQLTEFLKTAAALQVRGLADVSSKDQDKLSNMSASVPWTTNDDDASMYVNANSRSSCGKRSSLNVENSSSSKKPRPNENQNLRYSVSPPTNRASVASDNADGKPSSLSDSVHSLPQGDERSQSAQNSQPAHSSNGDESSDYDDEASDADGDPEAPDDNVGVHDLAPPRLEVPDFAMSDRAKGDGLNPGLFDPQRHRGAYPNPLGINFHDIAGIFPNLNMHSSSQDNYVSVTSGCGGVPGGGTGSSSSSSSSACYGGLVEPKPICKECGRVYSSISNLKQHIANVHSTTPQWEPCPMCGKHFKTRQYLFNHLLQTHGLMRGNAAEVLKVRATDPRPCPKCNKIYRSAHTLRTHLEDKHTVCPGYRCVLCGTVAKSRNSLHSHMSRQHRGISTKDLPVVPMPAPFNPELASQLYAKAGYEVSPADIRARTSPPGVVTQLARRAESKQETGSTSSDNNSSSPDDPQDLSINSSRNNSNANQHQEQQQQQVAIPLTTQPSALPTTPFLNQGTLPAEYHHAANVNSKCLGQIGILMNSLLPLVSMDKENVNST